MTKQALLEKIEKNIRITEGHRPLVTLPLREWEKLERILEDYKMISSKNFLRSIKEARKQLKTRNVFKFDLKTGKFKKR